MTRKLNSLMAIQYSKDKTNSFAKQKTKKYYKLSRHIFSVSINLFFLKQQKQKNCFELIYIYVVLHFVIAMNIKAVASSVFLLSLVSALALVVAFISLVKF